LAIGLWPFAFSFWPLAFHALIFYNLFSNFLANSQQPTANSQQPTANSQQPKTKGQRPKAKSQRPTAKDRKFLKKILKLPLTIKDLNKKCLFFNFLCNKPDFWVVLLMNYDTD